MGPEFTPAPPPPIWFPPDLTLWRVVWVSSLYALVIYGAYSLAKKVINFALKFRQND